MALSSPRFESIQRTARLAQVHQNSNPNNEPKGLSSIAALPPSVLVAVGLLSVAFLGLFFRFLRQQNEHSYTYIEDWGHAYIIPGFCLYLIWRERAKILAQPQSTFWPALGPLALGVMTYFFFIVGVSNHMLQGGAMILVLESLVLFLFGPKIFRYLFLPIAFLFFGVTISEQVMIKLTFQLQLIASKGAGILLQLIAPIWGYFIDVDGNTLILTYGSKKIPLNVAEACSGMRMVIAFFALAAAISVLSCKHWWQRAAVFLLAPAVAVFMNIIRVAVLAVASIYDTNLAAGSAHMIIGTLLLVPGLFLFLGIVWALNKAVDDVPDAPSGAKP